MSIKWGTYMANKKAAPPKKTTGKKAVTQKAQKQRKNMRTEIICAILFLVMLFSILGEFGLTMVVGDFLVWIFNLLFGVGRFFMYPILIYLLWHIFKNKQAPPLDMRMTGFVIFLFAMLILISLPSYMHIENTRIGMDTFYQYVKFQQPTTLVSGGGIIGVGSFLLLKQFTGVVGGVSISLFLLLLGLALALGRTLHDIIYPPIEATKQQLGSAKQSISDNMKQRKEKKIFDAASQFDEDMEDQEEIDLEPEEPEEMFYSYDDEPLEHEEAFYSYDEEVFNSIDLPLDEMIEASRNIAYEQQHVNGFVEEHAEDVGIEDDLIMTPSLSNQVQQKNVPYKLPPLNYLINFNKDGVKQNTDRSLQKRLLQETLDNFGVKATVSAVRVGPAVTQYEVTLAPGVKVSRIVNLSTDISLALAAKGVRIEAPIPGKAAVGIEIPNETVQMVGLYEVLRKTHKDKSEKLLVGLGRMISGEEVLVEINKMPHLLVAGSTGSGKSVCINTIITSILLRTTPDEVKFLMIDPKKVELNVYNDIPHLLAPVVTEPKRAAVALKKVVGMMEERYELFADAFVRNLDGYNDYARENGREVLPYIVVIIDELADLMVVAAKEVEESIMRLAQMARAAGIHMIVATQRPSVDVITGVIKSNIPSRIAFAVSSQIDSRTILDMGGAERLVGKGDMLYLPAGEAKPVRVQGAYVSENEIEKIVSFVKNQQKTEFNETLVQATEAPEIEELFNGDEVDPLFEEAVLFAISIEMISTSKLQRRFRIGFNRASRIMDEMIEKGILGPSSGNKGRLVLIEDISEVTGLINGEER